LEEDGFATALLGGPLEVVIPAGVVSLLLLLLLLLLDVVDAAEVVADVETEPVTSVAGEADGAPCNKANSARFSRMTSTSIVDFSYSTINVAPTFVIREKSEHDRESVGAVRAYTQSSLRSRSRAAAWW